jgi:hypothetical protein
VATSFYVAFPLPLSYTDIIYLVVIALWALNRTRFRLGVAIVLGSATQ